MAETITGAALASLRATAAIAEDMKGNVQKMVDSARADGATWEQIGQALGITKQAAHQRYGRRREVAADG